MKYDEEFERRLKEDRSTDGAWAIVLGPIIAIAIAAAVLYGLWLIGPYSK